MMGMRYPSAMSAAFHEWYGAAIACVVLLALGVVLVLDVRLRRRRPGEARWFRVVAICAFFAVVVFPLAYGIPIIISDMAAARLQTTRPWHRRSGRLECSEMWQYAIVVIVIAAAVVGLGYLAKRRVSGKGTCACGMSSQCPIREACDLVGRTEAPDAPEGAPQSAETPERTEGDDQPSTRRGNDE